MAIEGIRVLYTYTEPSGILALWLLLAVSALVWGLFEALEENWVMCSLSAIAIGLLVWICFWDVTTPKYTYHKVILNSAPYAALIEHYEVTGNEGEILTVTKRADNKTEASPCNTTD